MSERRLRIAIAALALVGLGIASYLTYVHYAHAQVLCVAGGGGCEKVQSSDQSRLAGVPVAVLGMVGYFGILLSALVRGEPGRVAGALLALMGFGFSAYLTYAELFVIDAICQWCVASAVVMTAEAVLASARLLAPPQRDAHQLAYGG
ncbi:MAG: vitamin K epoxide reductase family protein [Thermoleophilaceae bacterium]|nr:vitamin K epoxide reductase family protein [Thermoleophilaceae bacterium]